MNKVTKDRIKRQIKSGKIYKTKKYKDWRGSVFRRDRYMCQMCKKVGGYIEAHHIKLKSKFPELTFSVLNGITLCGGCHKKIHADDSYKTLVRKFKKIARDNKPKPRLIKKRRRTKRV